MKFKPNKTSYKDVVVATHKDNTIHAIRSSRGDYGVSVKQTHTYDRASFYGKKDNVIKALELVIEELKGM